MHTRSLSWVLGLVAAAVLNIAQASNWNSANYDLYPGDFNGDGATDVLFVARNSSSQSGIALSNGVEWVAGAQYWNSDGFGLQWHSGAYIPVVGDFNWDGRDDIFMHRQTPGDHVLMLTQPDGTITGAAQTIPNSRAGLVWSGDQHRVIAIKAKVGNLKGHRLFLQAVAAGGTSAIIDTSSSLLISASTYGSPWTDGYRGFQWNLGQSLIQSGDFNGDGDGDLLVQAKQQIVMVDFDVLLPVVFHKQGSFGIVYSPVANGVTAIWDRMQTGVDWSASKSNLIIADFDGDGRDDVLVQLKGVTNSAYLVRANPATNALYLASPATIAFPGAASGESYRYIAANINGGPSDRAFGLYLQGESTSGADLIAAWLPAAGGSSTTVAQNAVSQVAGHVERAFMTATRYNLAGQITGTIQPDPDGNGSLKYLAVRNTYDRGLVVMMESGQLGAWVNDTVAPANWEQVTTFSRYIITEMTYDNYGRLTTKRVRSGETNAVESLEQYSYDLEGRVRCLAQRMNRDAFTSPPDACTVGPEGTQGPDRISRFAYDSLDQMLTEEQGLGTSSLQTVVTNEYDNNLLRFQTDANGNKTEYRYDSFKRLQYRFYPSATIPGFVNTQDFNEYTYFATGAVRTERTRDGKIINYSYDATNRIIRKDLSDNTHSPDVNYDYYRNGVLKYARFGPAAAPGVEHTGAGITNTTNGFGLVTSTRINNPGAADHNGASRTIGYSYDDNGNRTSLAHPDGQSFGYAHDGLNRTCALAEGAAPASCDAGGTILKLAYGSHGARTTITRAGVVTTYDPDPIGRMEYISQNFPVDTNDLTNTFTYNPAGQITQLVQSNDLYSYSGNVHRAGNYARNGLNQYTTVGGQPIGYDANGNLTTDPTLGYSLAYDMENRLVSTTGTAANTAALKYDPFGRLAQISVNGTTTDFLYDGDDLIAEYSGGVLVKRYVHGDAADEPWVQYEGATVSSTSRRFLYSDHQGSIIAISDSAGNVLNKLSYDNFGQPGVNNVGRFGYTGQAWIRELGLFYYKARMYSPLLGRFLQPDPAFYSAGMNLYAYVSNDPMNLMDPSGLTATREYLEELEKWNAERKKEFWEKPGTAESFIPIWGSGKSAANAFANGEWGWGIWHSFLAVTDVIPVKAAYTVFGKGAWKGGSHAWKATRAWLARDSGGNFARKFQDVDHWLIPRRWFENKPWKKWGEAIFNQKWNLKALEPPAGYTMDQWHRLLDGRDAGLKFLERWWHRTPDWARKAEASAAADAVGLVED